MADYVEFQIARLELEDGDILVIKSDRTPHASFQPCLPAGVRILYIPTDVELSVLTKSEIEARLV